MVIVDTDGPVDVEVSGRYGASEVTFQPAAPDEVAIRAAAPKGLAWSRPSFGPTDDGGWRATAPVDV